SQLGVVRCPIQLCVSLLREVRRVDQSLARRRQGRKRNAISQRRARYELIFFRAMFFFGLSTNPAREKSKRVVILKLSRSINDEGERACRWISYSRVAREIRVASDAAMPSFRRAASSISASSRRVIESLCAEGREAFFREIAALFGGTPTALRAGASSP